jgi:hypothetical protein
MQKEKVLEVVESLSEEVDVDALIERLYLLQKIEIAERQLAAGQGIPHEEAKKRLEPWLK